jgi:O-methyltransferase
MLKEIAKSIARVLGPPIVRNRPIATWPGWLGLALEVKVPRAVIPKGIADPTGRANINILTAMIERTRSLTGAVADCGVYKAASTVGMALFMRQHGIRKQIYAFDSFQGFDSESVAGDLDLGEVNNKARYKVGYSDFTLEQAKSKIRSFRINNITLVPGYFNQSFKTLPPDIRFSFVHLDVNLYESYREGLEFFYPRLDPSGIILLDEYNDPPWPGCNKAADEFLAGKPETLQMASRDNYQKWYLVKQ